MDLLHAVNVKHDVLLSLGAVLGHCCSVCLALLSLDAVVLDLTSRLLFSLGQWPSVSSTIYGTMSITCAIMLSDRTGAESLILGAVSGDDESMPVSFRYRARISCILTH